MVDRAGESMEWAKTGRRTCCVTGERLGYAMLNLLCWMRGCRIRYAKNMKVQESVASHAEASLSALEKELLELARQPLLQFE